MKMSTVSMKGQVTIPAEVRKDLGLKPHDRISFVRMNGQTVIRRVQDLFELKGFLGKAASTEEEQEAMETAAAEHALGFNE